MMCHQVLWLVFGIAFIAHILIHIHIHNLSPSPCWSPNYHVLPHPRHALEQKNGRRSRPPHRVQTSSPPPPPSDPLPPTLPLFQCRWKPEAVAWKII